VTFQQQATTIEQCYTDELGQSEESLSTTSPRDFILVTGQFVAEQQSVISVHDSPASSLCAYLISSVTPFNDDGGSSATLRRDFILYHEPRPQGFQDPHASSRRERHAAVIALLDEWLSDDSGYDEATWPGLKEHIEEARTSTRKRFSE